MIADLLHIQPVKPILLLLIGTVLLASCARMSVTYPGPVQSAQMFADICGAATRSFAQAREATARYGFVPREVNDQAFTHPALSVWGHFRRTEGGPVTMRNGTVVAHARPRTVCEMDVILPIFDGCSGGHAEQKREVDAFRKALGARLGPDRDLSDLNSLGVYVRGGGGAKKCIRNISATVWAQ